MYRSAYQALGRDPQGSSATIQGGRQGFSVTYLHTTLLLQPALGSENRNDLSNLWHYLCQCD